MKRSACASAATARGHLDDLAALLKEAVDEGAGVGFLAPFALPEARAHWEGVLPDVDAGRRALLVARADGRVVGTTMLERARAANGRLLQEAERVARAEEVTLLVLDAGGAGGLYERAGYAKVGVVPRYHKLL